MKRLVVCCDGTWQRLSQAFPTNVVKTASSVLPRDGAGVAQLIFYDEGVGTDQTFAPRAASVFGGAFGRGLEENVAEAYRFIVLNYEPGDDIFIFGFSRGAFTARSLCGLIDKVGVLRRAECVRATEAFRFYVMHQELGATTFERFGSYTYDSREVGRAIAYLGVWDTVGARGLPESIPGALLLNRRYSFHSTALSRIIRSARHAVSIDERRRTFPACLWDETANATTASQPDGESQRYQQVWFMGDHGNVGGGVELSGLSNIALTWVLQGASKAGLALDPVQLEFHERHRNCLMPFSNAILRDLFSPTQWAYALVGAKDRSGPMSIVDVHPSVLLRWREDDSYRPSTLSRVAAALDRGDSTNRAGSEASGNENW